MSEQRRKSPPGKKRKPAELFQEKKDEIAAVLVRVELIRRVLSRQEAGLTPQEEAALKQIEKSIQASPYGLNEKVESLSAIESIREVLSRRQIGLTPEEKDEISRASLDIQACYDALVEKDKYSEINLFTYKVQRYLDGLNWTYADLAHHIKVSAALVSVWLGDGKDRVVRLPAKDDVCRIAWAITGGQDGELKSLRDAPDAGGIAHDSSKASETKRTDGGRSGRGELAFILDELLQAAGYAGVQGRAENRAWERISGSSHLVSITRPKYDTVSGEHLLPTDLRVGWVTSNPLFYLPAALDGGPQGLAADIVRCLADYLGVRLDWVDVRRRSDLGRCLREGQIDLVAPMAVHFPKRMIDMNFTTGIPGLRCGMNCILKKSEIGEVSTTGFQPQQLSEVDPDRIKIEYMPGDIGAYGVSLFAPRWAIKNDVFRPHSGNSMTEKSPDLQSVYSDLINYPREYENGEKGRVRCYLTGQLTCYRGVVDSRDKVDSPDKLGLLLPQTKSPVKLPYAFGVAYTEPRLHRIIDNSLRIIFDDYDVMYRLYYSAQDDLRDLAEADIIHLDASSPQWLTSVLKDLKIKIHPHLDRRAPSTSSNTA